MMKHNKDHRIGMSRHALSLLWLTLIVSTGTTASAATNLGLYVTTAKPQLYVQYGNPTEYPKAIPGGGAWIPLDLGSEGTYFHRTATTNFVEVYPPLQPGNNPPYGGPGDSWCSLSLTSPTPGNTATTPIVYRFDSRIHNRDSGIVYQNGGGNFPGNQWSFDQPATNVHFRVEWQIDFTGTPYQITNCYFNITNFTLICTNAIIQSLGALITSFRIDGYGEVPVYSGVIGPGAVSYSGTVTGVANSSHLLLEIGHGFYVGQANRGDSHVIVEYKVYADTQPLIRPTLSVSPALPDGMAISWSPNTPGYLLQETASLAPLTWTNSPSGATNPVVVPITESVKLYRLFKP